MGQDIDRILEQWEYRPRTMQARLILAGDSREVIQVRIDLGLLQLEKEGRPDGERPGGFSTYREYLEQVIQDARTRGEECILTEEQCHEADREFLQFYHRRISWLTLRNFARAIADADHTLRLMDLVREHSPSEEYQQAHEQYRGFVLFQRTQAAVALAMEQDDAAQAIAEIHTGLEKMRQFFSDFDLEEEMEEDGMVQHLRRLEENIRSKHAVGPTLQEQLAEAVAREDYEAAARLRDELRQRRNGPGVAEVAAGGSRSRQTSGASRTLASSATKSVAKVWRLRLHSDLTTLATTSQRECSTNFPFSTDCTGCSPTNLGELHNLAWTPARQGIYHRSSGRTPFGILEKPLRAGQ